MTNSYNLSPVPKIVFIHGLNNNSDAFTPIIEHFQNIGFETELIILPGHGQDRRSISNFKEAMESFESSMEKIKGAPYSVIAFSQGALYLELWLQKNFANKPHKKVLLAPALAIRRQYLIEITLKYLPDILKIRSLSPKEFKRYDSLTIREYKILIEGIKKLENTKSLTSIKTLTMIDPKDELVDAQRLKHINDEIILIERPKLKKGVGCHHILFHPEYFPDDGWRDFTRKIELFLVK